MASDWSVCKYTDRYLFVDRSRRYTWRVIEALHFFQSEGLVERMWYPYPKKALRL